MVLLGRSAPLLGDLRSGKDPRHGSKGLAGSFKTKGLVYVGAAWETVNESVEDKGLAGSSKIQRSHKDVKPSIFKFIGLFCIHTRLLLLQDNEEDGSGRLIQPAKSKEEGNGLWVVAPY
ncbi:hypothetical protein YC2023_078646 [Brassica napus]